MTYSFKKRFGVATLEDISTLILNSHDLGETLNNIVKLVAKRMGTEVCSIYLLEKPENILRLKATKGLARKAVGKVCLKKGEGLTGLVLEKCQVLTIQEPYKDPRNRYFRETREELYHSFLGIPLLDRKEAIGVIVIQTKSPREFTPEEISTLSTIAFQISFIVINARLLDSIKEKEKQTGEITLSRRKGDRRSATEGDIAPLLNHKKAFTGTAIYPGVVSGPCYIVDDAYFMTEALEEKPRTLDEELERMEGALEHARMQTLFLEKRVAERLSQNDAAIFHTHLMILEDRGFLGKWEEEIRAGESAVFSLRKVVRGYISAFEQMEDPYLRERAADIKDIGQRLLVYLSGGNEKTLTLKEPSILIYNEIHPSDLAGLDLKNVRGIIAEAGGETSHAAIMAKSLGVPVVFGAKGVLGSVSLKDFLILDADSGCVHVSPGGKLISQYKRLEENSSREVARLEEWRDRSAQSCDGVKVTLRANIGPVSDVDIALHNGASGVGLFRTEFHYMVSPGFPSREDQYRYYRYVVERFSGHSITIRTFDIGGDKVLPYFKCPEERNPFMGWRSLRISLDHRDIFLTQIEAILMASAHGSVKILFPMVSGLQDVRDCKDVIDEARSNLARQGRPFADRVQVGAMIEIPAVVKLARLLAREVDFFSIGTNDLIQYMLAADRNNALIRRYYDPLHPAVLQVIKEVQVVAADEGVDLCLCGEMASDPLKFLLLFGLGIREFSIPSPFIPRIKAFLSTVESGLAKEIGENILEMESSQDIRAYLKKKIAAL
jgi:phosphotransferase system, enzyme I, PtsP